MSRVEQSIRVRAQEIIQNSPTAMGTQEALEQALVERYQDDFAGLAKAAAALGAGALKGIRKRTYEIQEEDGQGSLFDVPSYIGIRTTQGDMLVPKDQATLGHVRQWQREGQQHHATQLQRFKRAGKALDSLKDEDESLEWFEARPKMLGLPSAESEDEEEGE